MLFDDRYRLKKKLGSGGFSEVWLVEDAKVGYKKMALKVYVPDKGLDDDGIQLFSSEFELVFDLNHTHLLRPAHFDVCENSPYLLMPYCEQGSASKWVGRLEEEEAWHFLHDVASGLAFLHAQNQPIIHQDIKPDNILRDAAGQYQITDFGISTKARSTLRKSMNVVKSGGTMAYMPPERFGKDNTPIKASDVWAVGATLYELLAGDMPFGEHGGLMQKSGAEIPNLPGKQSKELQEIITRCLHKDPWDRPVAQQIVEWTEKHFKGEKIVFDKKGKKSKTKTIMLATGAAAVCILLAYLTIWHILPSTQNKTSEPAAEAMTAVTGERVLTDEEANERTDEGQKDEGVNGRTDEVTVNPSTQPVVSDPGATSSTSTSPPSTPSPSAWVADYDRILNTALSAYSNRDFVRAKQEYNRALALANRNGDRQKATFVSGQITECDKAIEAVEVAKRVDEERRQRETQERLATYNFVGTFSLGTEYLIVQRKSNNRYGIIRKDGTEAEPFNYTQVSARLKDGYYALRNEQGWVVFDTRMQKVASNLENLNDYR